MPDIPGWVIEILKYGGMPALMFLIWYFYHAAQAKQWTMFFEGMQKAQAAQNTRDDEKSQRDYDLLKDTIETVGMHTAILARIEGKIDNGVICKVAEMKNLSNQMHHIPQISPHRS